MYTGIILGLGTVVAVNDRDQFREIVVDVGALARQPEIGASVAIDGVCLTITHIGSQPLPAEPDPAPPDNHSTTLTFHAMQETLAKTTIGSLEPGDNVNVETSLRMGDELGGHLVLGHVDDVGEIIEKEVHGENTRMRFRVPPSLSARIVDKGSIAIDGISLTVCNPTTSPLPAKPDPASPDNHFDIWLLPLTLERTTLGFKTIGDKVNVETDHHAQQFDIRPWGRFDVLEEANDCKVKRLTINPGKRISYQRHQHRTEHWTIVAGEADVTLDGVTTHHTAGETVVITEKTKHRLANNGTVPLMVIEVQLGSYFGEDDIERFDDDFGRV